MDLKNKSLANNWVGRSLPNYKAIHAKRAQEKGIAAEFQAAKTLTAAKKLLFGFKNKNTRKI